MNETITVDGINYATENVTTGINMISFKLSGLTVAEAETAFRNAGSLTVGSGEGQVYGSYPDVRFDSLMLCADGSVTVTMHILTETEKQIKELQISQSEQDEVIAELLYGGGEEDE